MQRWIVLSVSFLKAFVCLAINPSIQLSALIRTILWWWALQLTDNLALPLYTNSFCWPRFSSGKISMNSCSSLRPPLLVFSRTGWHSVDSEMGFVAGLSLTRFIFYFLTWELKSGTILAKQFLFYFIIQRYSFWIFIPHGQFCLWQFLVTIISHKFNQHIELYLQSLWLKEKPDAVCELEQHTDLIWVDISKSQPEFGILLNVLLNILLAGTSATKCLINIQLLYTSDLQLQMTTLTQFNLEWKSKWQLSP